MEPDDVAPTTKTQSGIEIFHGRVLADELKLSVARRQVLLPRGEYPEGGGGGLYLNSARCIADTPGTHM